MSIAYVEAKPGGFVFDVAGSRLVKNLSDPLNSLRLLAVCLFAAVRKSRLMKKLSDSHGAYCAGSLLIVYE